MDSQAPTQPGAYSVNASAWEKSYLNLRTQLLPPSLCNFPALTATVPTTGHDCWSPALAWELPKGSLQLQSPRQEPSVPRQSLALLLPHLAKGHSRGPQPVGTSAPENPEDLSTQWTPRMPAL